MRFKSLGSLALAALVALAGCSTPCDAPGRLCAPAQANTSAPAPHPRAEPPAQPPAAAAPEPVAEVIAIDMPPPSATPAKRRAIRIGLLLPLTSDTLGQPAEAVRAGFMAAFERDRAGVTVNLVDSGESPQQALDSYAAAAAQNDILVGPLSRPAVSAVASSPVVTKPTIALNYPEPGPAAVALPQNMLVMGLSIEDEARQVAAWASAEQPPRATALIVTGASAWQRRLASAFAAEWQRRGRSAQIAELAAANGYLSEASLGQLKQRVEAEPPGLLFTALDADQLRQLRAVVGTALPCYGTSSVNPGTEPGMAMAELDGLRLLDLPWEVHPDHPAVMVYPRWTATAHTLDMDRLYALGIDAFRVAHELALHPDGSFAIDGVTGHLQVRFGRGQAARFERVEPAAVYQGGAFKLLGGP
ncbi:MAG TPA: penicillin-binding protein activator [Telluria sp.]|nr:penicillin-binding protein activator [Telluria sp.]